MKKRPTVRYKPFPYELEREVFLGKRVALLVRRRAKPLDAGVMRRITGALDRAADYYARVTQQEPSPLYTLEGRITIAEVPEIGGAAWGMLGQTGIEVSPPLFEILYDGVKRRDEFDQPLFYELGRNYWTFERTLDLHPGSVATGFAVHMRFLAMKAARVKGAPYRRWPFEEFRRTVDSMLDTFAAAKKPSWEELLAKPPAVVQVFEKKGRDTIALSTADLLSALFTRLGEENGGSTAFMTKLCAAARTLTPMTDAPLESEARGLAICANLLEASSIAAGRDLTDRFREWRWPRT